jgi:hypothetical protein
VRYLIGFIGSTPWLLGIYRGDSYAAVVDAKESGFTRVSFHDDCPPEIRCLPGKSK